MNLLPAHVIKIDIRNDPLLELSSITPTQVKATFIHLKYEGASQGFCKCHQEVLLFSVEPFFQFGTLSNII